MQDVIIIGAGMAGLSAALALKDKGLSYFLLEAAGEVGGRAITRRLPSGVAADLGPHWLHGEDNELGAVVKAYGLSGRKDDGDQMRVYENGRVIDSGEDWLDTAVDWDMAEAIKSGKAQDVAISELGRDEESRRRLRRFGQGWNGLQAPLEPSAYEFLTDQNEPGGLQLNGGIAALTAKMADDIGRDAVRLNYRVGSVAAIPGGVRVDDLEARHAIVTVSLGVLQSRAIAFDAEVQTAIDHATAGLLVSRMNKIILELEPGFFNDRGIPADLGLQLLDGIPHYCHVRGAGQPLIVLFTTGDAASYSETLTPDQALDYARDVLSPVEQLKGFDARLASAPLVTRWIANPLTRGAYSALMPGFKRHAPWWNGPIGICGDSFDDHFPGSLAGAWRSGRRLVEAL